LPKRKRWQIPVTSTASHSETTSANEEAIHPPGFKHTETGCACTCQCRMQSPPIGILNLGTSAILSYLNDLLNGQEPYLLLSLLSAFSLNLLIAVFRSYRMKLMVVGQENVGYYFSFSYYVFFNRNYFNTAKRVFYNAYENTKY
jgi:hypothetical protein